MPELPDICNYVSALERFVAGRVVQSVFVRSPFVLRTVEPSIFDCEGRAVESVERMGKRLVLALEGEMFVVIHLMIAGRLHWKKVGTKPSRKVDLAAFRFENGCLLLTEASPRKRASIHVHGVRAECSQHDRGGLDLLTCSFAEFRDRLLRLNRTLKRSLTDPQLFDGVGNAYSDEILHSARLSPLRLTRQLGEEECLRLLNSARRVLTAWVARLQNETGGRFPEKVTAFHPDMAVHGKFGQPCPDCETKVQKIVYAERQLNYCPHCQTGSRILKDRSLSRLLKDDWPGALDTE